MYVLSSRHCSASLGSLGFYLQSRQAPAISWSDPCSLSSVCKSISLLYSSDPSSWSCINLSFTTTMDWGGMMFVPTPSTKFMTIVFSLLILTHCLSYFVQHRRTRCYLLIQLIWVPSDQSCSLTSHINIFIYLPHKPCT